MSKVRFGFMFSFFVLSILLGYVVAGWDGVFGSPVVFLLGMFAGYIIPQKKVVRKYF